MASGLNPDQLLKLMVAKKLKSEGAPAFRDLEVDGLEDIEIPPEQDEVLGGLAKLFQCGDKDYLTLAELVEFEALLAKNGIVERGGLLKKGGLLENVELLNRDNLTEEQKRKARNFSLENHLKPAIDKLSSISQESEARKKAIAMGRLAKEKEVATTSKKVSTSESQAKTKEKPKRDSSESSEAKKNGKGSKKEQDSKEGGEKSERASSAKVAPVAASRKLTVEPRKTPVVSSKAASSITKALGNMDNFTLECTTSDSPTRQSIKFKKSTGGGNKSDGWEVTPSSSGNDKLPPELVSKIQEALNSGLVQNDLQHAVRRAVAEEHGKGKAVALKDGEASAQSKGEAGGGSRPPRVSEAFQRTKDKLGGSRDKPAAKTDQGSQYSRLEADNKPKSPQRSNNTALKAEPLPETQLAPYPPQKHVKHPASINSVRQPPPRDKMSASYKSSSDEICSFRQVLYRSESKFERPGPDGEGAPVISYKIALRCLARASSDVQMLEFWRMPETGANIKDRIERQLQIPTSFQHDLSYNGKPIEDSTELKSIDLKPKSKLELTYLCEGQLEDVRVALRFYEFFVKFGRNKHSSVYTGQPLEYAMLCYQGITEQISENLAANLFMPWDADDKYANRVYFIQKNGIDRLVDVYELLTIETWRTLPLRMKLLEAGCIKILSALGCSTMNRQKILAADGHGFVMQSLLRVLIRPPRGQALVDHSRSPGPAKTNNFLLKELLDAVVEFFVNYRECAEVHIDICSKNNSVEQIISIVHSPSFTIQQAQDCLCLLACCMHSADTHKWLCKNHTLDGIADSVKVHRERGVADSDDVTLLHYYAQVTLAHLVSTSIQFISKKVTEKLVPFFEDFLSKTTPSTIDRLEKRRRSNSSWTPFLPYLKVLLSPVQLNADLKTSVNRSEKATILHLMNLGVETMLFVMQVMSVSDPYKARRQLLEEKILSYALCLSANVPRKLLPSARAVVSALRSDSSKPVPIPKLNIMARAKLASVHFSLKRVMDRQADELKLEVSPPPPRPAHRAVAPTSAKEPFNPMICVISM